MADIILPQVDILSAVDDNTNVLVEQGGVAQTTVSVLENDTPEILAARVLEREHTFLVEVIADIISEKIALG